LWSNGAAINYSGQYRIVNRNSGKVMDVPASSTADHALIKQYTWNGGNNQRFTITNLGRGEYRIVNVNSGKSLDNPSSSRTVGTNIIQYTNNSNFSQKWNIIACKDGYYRFVSVNTLGKTLGISGASTANSAGVVLSLFNFANDQQWQLVSASAAAASTGEALLQEEGSALERSTSDQLEAYPIPFKDKVTLAVSLTQETNVNIGMFFPTSGEKIKEYSFEKLAPGNHQLELDGKELKPGLYIYRTFINGELKTGKLIKIE